MAIRRAARPRPPATVAVVLAALLALAGCGGDEPERPPATAAPSSAPPSTAPATFPLTGMPAGDAARAARPALSIKIDNINLARPQAGLNEADLVVEQPVEGGLTRLFATYHSNDANLVGPVRSARPVDALLLRQLGPSLFAFAGAAAGVLQVVERESGATLLDSGRAQAAYQRVGSRRAPHNTFTSTPGLYQAGKRVKPDLGPPRDFLAFDEAAPASGRGVGVANLQFSPSARSSWRWDGGAGQFVRSQDGSLDWLQDGKAVTSQNVVVMSVAIKADRNVDVLGNATPDPVLVRSGRAWVLRDGKVLTGRWRRRSATGPAELLGADGEAIPLHPGRTWIELLPSSRQPSFTGP